MYVVFEVSKQFKTIVSSRRKKYLLSEANNILSRLDQYAEENQIRESVKVTILSNKTVVFADEYPLGVKKARNLLVMVKETFRTTFQDAPEEKKVELFKQIQEAMLEKESISKEPIVSNMEVPEEKIKVVKAKKGKKKLPSFRFSLSKKQVRILVGLVLFCLVSAGAIVFATTFVSEKNEVIEVPKKTYDDYFKEGKYKEALSINNQTKKREQVVEKLVKEQDFKQLDEINQLYPTVLGSFESAFYHQDWESVVAIPLDSLSEDRKVMLSHAYVQLDQLEEAETLNELIKSDVIAKEISIGYFERGMNALRNKDVKKAEEIQKKINNDLLADYITETKAYIKLLDSYREKKETAKVEQWEKIIKNLGKE